MGKPSVTRTRPCTEKPEAWSSKVSPRDPFVARCVQRDVVGAGAVAVLVEVEALVALVGVVCGDAQTVGGQDFGGQIDAEEVDCTEVAVGDEKVAVVHLIGHHGPQWKGGRRCHDRGNVLGRQQSRLDEWRQAPGDEGLKARDLTP